MGNRISEIAERYNLSIRGMALRCGMQPPTLVRMVNGVMRVNLGCVIALLEVFPDISPDWLLMGKGEMLRSSGGDAVRCDKLVDTIALLQETINAKDETIKLLSARLEKQGC